MAGSRTGRGEWSGVWGGGGGAVLLSFRSLFFSLGEAKNSKRRERLETVIKIKYLGKG
jgi:hypothetical protein